MGADIASGGVIRVRPILGDFSPVVGGTGSLVPGNRSTTNEMGVTSPALVALRNY